MILAEEEIVEIDIGGIFFFMRVHSEPGASPGAGHVQE